MAERRMYAKTIVLSDAFLNMPMSARCLYFTLGMLADDDGFVNAPRSVMRQCGASEDDMKLLILKKFVIEFETGVIVIKHWRINNYLRSDRYTETKYTDEKDRLYTDKTGTYHIKGNAGIPPGIPIVGIPPGIPRLGKDSIDTTTSTTDIPTTLSPKGDTENVSKDTQNVTYTKIRDGMDRFSEQLEKPPTAADYLMKMGIDLGDYFIAQQYAGFLEDGMEEDAVMYAAYLAKAGNKVSWAYVKTILDSWITKGIVTKAQAEEEEKKRKAERIANAGKSQSSSKSPYKPDGTYDYEAGESKEWPSLNDLI